jgi:hypothetical protein
MDMIAVIAGNRIQYDLFAREHPEVCGKPTNRSRTEHENAFCVTRTFHIEGRCIDDFIKIGLWNKLPNIKELVGLCVLAKVVKPAKPGTPAPSAPDPTQP